MKRILWIFIVLVCQVPFLQAQWEYQYFSVRFGLNHNLLSPQPGDFQYRELQTPYGNIKLYPDNSENSNYFYYGADFTADLLFHYDFEGDNLGFAIGAQYSTNGLGAKYVTNIEDLIDDDRYNVTDPKSYELIEKYRIHSIGFPLIFKFGSDIYEKQCYFYVGAQYNLNMNFTQIQTVNWLEDERYVKKGLSDGLKKGNILAFAGFNYLVFNFEVGMMPGSFFDEDYTDSDGFAIYESQGKNIFYIKTCISIPISEWLVLNSWQAEKLRRKLFNRGE